MPKIGESGDVPLSAKKRHVVSQGQTRPHRCHGGMPGCLGQCPPAMWGCRPCWMRLPKTLRDMIWQAYRPGQEVTRRPNKAYVEVAKAVRRWVRENYEGVDDQGR